MSALQTTYSEVIGKGYPGMIANGETSNRITRTCEDAGGVGFGIALYRGADDHGATATVGTLASFYGWSIADQTLAPSTDADEYQQFDNMAIITSGAVFITVTGAVTDGAPISVGTGASASAGYGATGPSATHIATGWVADETVTDGLCRIVKR